MKHILLYLIAGTRGGETRAMIIDFIRLRPANAHKIAKALNLDYKTVTHHLKILLENKILAVVAQKKYGAIYLLDEFFERDIHIYEEIVARFGNKSGKNK